MGEPSEGAGRDPAPDPVDTVRGWLSERGVPLPDSTPSAGADRSVERRRPGSRQTAVRDGSRFGDAGPPGPDADADPEEIARTIVLRKLSAQARTRAELERALKTKEVPGDAAAAVLDKMTEVGLVDDAAFARDWVASRQQRRHLSRSALRRELQGKGVDREEIEEALAPVGADDEYEAALTLVRRRQQTMAALPRDVQYRRLAGVLARRGFGGSVVSQALSEVLDGAQPSE